MDDRPFQDEPDLLAWVRARPGMYLGGKSIRGLRCFLSGIGVAEVTYAVPAERRLGGFDWERFEVWVRRRLNPTGEGPELSSFCSAERDAGPDGAGFDLWFEWYDEFRREPAAAAVAPHDDASGQR